MSAPVPHIVYPYITSDPQIAGGEPVIAGTRITVRCIAGYYQMGMDVDEILTSLSHLTAAQVHAALAYYFDHQDEIDQALAEQADEGDHSKPGATERIESDLHIETLLQTPPGQGGTR